MHENWSLKKGGRILRFEDVVLFNRALDNDKTIWKSMRESAWQPPNIRNTVRIMMMGIFRLFRDEKLELSKRKFPIFLLPSRKTDQIPPQKDAL